MELQSRYADIQAQGLGLAVLTYDSVETLRTFSEARGIEFFVPYRDIPSIELKIAFFTDPSGVVIELTEGFDLY